MRVHRSLVIGSVLAIAALAEPRTAGKVTDVAISASGAELQIDTGALAKVEFLAADIVRVRFAPGGTLSLVSTGAALVDGLKKPTVTVTQNSDGVFLQSASAIVAISKRQFNLTVIRNDRSVVSQDLPEAAIVWDSESGRIANRKVAQPDEAYFGLGARGGPINRRGRVITMRNVDFADYGEFTDPLYISIPFFYGLLNGKAYGIFFDNPAESIFDMDSRNQGVLTFGASEGELDYYVMTGPTPLDVSRAYAKLTGSNRLPPKWSLGYHQSRYSYDSQNVVLNLAREFRRQQIPCDVLWFDIDYMDQLKSFSWNPSTFPDPKTMIQDLKTLGFKSVAIVEPLMTPADPLWNAAADQNYLVRNRDGTPLVMPIWYGDVSYVDFTNVEARKWYKPHLADFLKLGIDGVWNDLNEPSQNFMPQAMYSYFGSNQPDRYARNVFSLHHVSLTDETQLEARPNVRPWAISRSGYSGIQRYAANWSGDTATSFDSLRVSIQMSVSMGLSGQNFFGHDIGGFLGSPSAELFIRWLQFGAYIPLFRNHATKETAPREPWSFGEPTTTLARDIINERYRLLPYIYTSFQQSIDHGRPLVAPLFFDFPEDAQTYSENYSFLFGPSLLVAPIYEEGSTTRTVYLPSGVNWYDYYSGRLYRGGIQIDVEAPLGRIPLFVREGAVIPSSAGVVQNTGEADRSVLNLDFWGGSAGILASTLYEDDGTSFDYLGGKFRSIQISRALTDSALVAQLRQIDGFMTSATGSALLRFRDYPGTPRRVYSNNVEIPRVDCSQLDGDGVPAWCFDAGRRLLAARVPRTTPLTLAVTP